MIERMTYYLLDLTMPTPALNSIYSNEDNTLYIKLTIETRGYPPFNNTIYTFN